MKFIFSILIAFPLFFAVAGQVQAAAVPVCTTQAACKVGNAEYICKGVIGSGGDDPATLPIENGKCGGPCQAVADCTSFTSAPFSWAAVGCTGNVAAAAVAGTCTTVVAGGCTQAQVTAGATCSVGTGGCTGGSAAKLASDGVCVELPSNQLSQGPQSGATLLGIVDATTNWIFAIFVVLAIIFVILAAFQFVTAGGDAAKVGEARQKLIWASVGVIVALLAKGIVPVVKAIVGG